MALDEKPASPAPVRINEQLTGTLDFNDLARQATQIIMKNYRLAAVGLLRVDHQEKVMRPYAYASQANPALISQVIQQPLKNFRAPLGRVYCNLTENTLNTGQPNISVSLGDFGYRPATRVLQKILGSKFHLSLPIKTKNRVEGVLLCATRQKKLDSSKIASLEATAKQLGLALENIIAHEQIMARLQKNSETKKDINPQKPKKKFTLRLTPEIDQYLSYKVANTTISKANYVRKVLEDLMAQDRDYHKFPS